MFMLIGLAAAALALVFARGRRVSIAAACLVAGVVASLPEPDYWQPGARAFTVVIFAAIAYGLVRIVARLTGAISKLGAPSAP